MKNFFKGKEGFTLIELVIAMTILIIILMVTTTMFVSSSELSGRITSSSEAQMACANMMERIRMLIVNSREIRIIDGETTLADGTTITTDWANAIAAEYPKDLMVTVEDYANKKSTVNMTLQNKYGYIVCGDPDSLTDGGITIYTPDASGNLTESKMYDQSNTTAVKLFTRFYKNGLTIKVKTWAVDKRYATWDEFEAVGTAASDAASDEDKKSAYEDALKDNCVFYQETEIITENASVTSRRKDKNTSSQSEGRVLKFYIEQ